MVTGGLVVEATIAGMRRRLIADTGAAVTIITPQVAESLTALTPPGLFHRVVFLGAMREMTVPVMRLPAVGVGAFRVEGIDAGVMPLPPRLFADGILGVDFLGRFRPTFEFDTATLVLRPIPRRGK
jgi:predicted aspartyl protease